MVSGVKRLDHWTFTYIGVSKTWGWIIFLTLVHENILQQSYINVGDFPFCFLFVFFLVSFMA